MSDLEAILVDQAHNCLQLVRSEQIDAALLVLDSINGRLRDSEQLTQLSSGAAKQLADILAQAHLGAGQVREDSRVKLQRLRNVRQVKATYSASSLPQ